MLAFVTAVSLSSAGWLRHLENISIDWRLKLTRRYRCLPDSIVLILIDEASLEALNPIAGRWPWDRLVHAGVIDYLNLAGAKAVVFDILFTERQNNRQDWDKTKADFQLTESTAQARVVHAAQLSGPRKSPNLYTGENAGFFEERFVLHVDGPDLKLPDYSDYYFPFNELQAASKYIGVVSIEPDSDGVIRKMPLVFGCRGEVLPSLGLAAAIMDEKKKSLQYSDNCLVIRTGSRLYKVPVDSQGRIRLNPYGKYQAYSYGGVYLSMHRMRQGKLDDLPVEPSLFKDRIVFIGASAAGVEDLKSTPLGPKTPGVLLHASVLANLIQDDFVHDADKLLNICFAGLLAAVSSLLIVSSNNLLLQVAGPLMVGACWWVITLWLASLGWIVEFVGPAFSLLLAFGGGLAVERYMERIEKGKIKKALGQYVSPTVLDKVISCHKGDFLGAEIGTEEKLSILFSDLRGFTTISQSMPVEQVVNLLNRYLSLMTDTIFDFQGTLDKFIGDAVVAFWGAPLPDQQHENRSVACALAMQRALNHFNQHIRKPAEPLLKMGIGINTDRVILGNIGSSKKLDYTIIGDGVNLASRMEGLTKYYRAPILISHSTYRKVRKQMVCRPVDVVNVRGRKGKTRIYQPLGYVGKVSRTGVQVAALSRQGLELFLEQRFHQAYEVFSRIRKIVPGDTIATIFSRRCCQKMCLNKESGNVSDNSALKENIR